MKCNSPGGSTVTVLSRMPTGLESYRSVVKAAVSGRLALCDAAKGLAECTIVSSRLERGGLVILWVGSSS